MISSMTGFARAETQVPSGVLVCELRSVNHRYLETSLRLPEELRALDPELRARLQKDLRRGKVDCILLIAPWTRRPGRWNWTRPWWRGSRRSWPNSRPRYGRPAPRSR